VEETTRTGIPLMRPLFLEYPQVNALAANDRDFLFGADLFVTPVFSEEDQSLAINLPPGEWYAYKSSAKHKSGDKIDAKPALDFLPVWVRGGAILPEQPLVQSTEEKPDGPLQLEVYPGEECRGTLYQDDGHTFAYQHGTFLRVEYACKVAGQNVTITSHALNGTFSPSWTSAEITIYGNTSAPKEVRLGDDLVHGWKFDGQLGTVTLRVPEARKDWSVRLVY
jgi:alpha-glucosidase